MRPIKLIFSGLNSFEKEQVIDMQKLTAAGLFGIFGPTGSGKSTIIDACTMALYSEMSRQSGRECINTNCSEMYVCLEFEIHNELYVAERAYSCDIKGLKQKRARLYKKTGDNRQIISDKPKEITTCVTELIGLKYSDFSRSVILPQGKFSEFLMLGERDRSDMLERIFGLEEYGDKFMKKLKIVKREYDGRLALTENSLQSYEGVTEASLENAETELLSDSRRLAELKDISEKIRTELDEKKKLREYINEYIGYERKLSECSKSAEQIDAKRRLLQTAVKAMAIKPFIIASNKTAEQITVLKTELKKNETELAEAERKLIETRELADRLASQKDSELPGLIETEAKIGHALEIEKELELIKSEREKLLNEYKVFDKEKSNFSDEREKKTNRCEDMRNELEVLSQRKAKVTISPERRQDTMDAFGLSKEVKKSAVGIAALDNKHKKLLSDSERDMQEINIIAQRIGQISIEKLKMTEKIEELHLHKPETKEIYELKKTLRENQPCPVCGSTHHPYMADTAVSAPVQTDISEWEKEIAELNEKITAFTEETNELNIKKAALTGKQENFDAQLKEVSRDIDNMTAERNELELRLDIFRQKLASDDFDALYTALAEHDKENTLIAEQETKLRKQVEILTSEAEKLAAEIIVRNTELQRIRTIGSEKSDQIHKLNLQLGSLIGERNPKEYLIEIRGKISELFRKVDDAKVALADTAERQRIRRAETESWSARLAALEGIHDTENKKISELLIEHGMANRDAVIAGWIEKTQADSLENEIKGYDEQVKDFRGNLYRMYKLISELFKSREEKEPKPDTTPEIVINNRLNTETESAINILEERYTAISDEINQKTGAVAVGKTRTEKMREDLKIVSELRKQKKALDHKLDLLNDLDSLFRGNEFVKYISKQHLRYITHEASRRMKEMTSGRYAIELDNTDFIIRDDFNGGSRRSPRTLSGGETFMVSLCLALALSSKLQLKNRTPLEFFFLDEGFGTLDNNILDTVMNCLEKLRSEKMSVGIISHVDELKSRIPTKLNVICDPNGGGSWVE